MKNFCISDSTLYLINIRISLDNINPPDILNLTQVAKGRSSKLNNNDGSLPCLKAILISLLTTRPKT